MLKLKQTWHPRRIRATYLPLFLWQRFLHRSRSQVLNSAAVHASFDLSPRTASLRTTRSHWMNWDTLQKRKLDFFVFYLQKIIQIRKDIYIYLFILKIIHFPYINRNMFRVAFTSHISHIPNTPPPGIRRPCPHQVSIPRSNMAQWQWWKYLEILQFDDLNSS